MKKVLVIENDSGTLDVIGLLLADSGFQVLPSENRVPIERIIEQSPRLIIIDYFLNDGYGNEICLELKANPLTKHIPVVLISTAPNIKQIAIDSFADGYIAKPFDIIDLENIVKALCA
jgi:two-component system phosphate regulon response regulator PhoB